jgi:hypothetical protein
VQSGWIYRFVSQGAKMGFIPNRSKIALLLLMFLCLGGCMGNIGGQFGHVDEPAPPLPEFPAGWPPPEASSYAKIPDRVFYNASTFGEATNVIAEALYDRGYTEVSYFATRDGGVALVTRLERFADNGSILPETERWSSGQDSRHDLFQMLHNMYFKPRGRYRVFVFFVGAGLPWARSPRTVTLDEARSWQRGQRAVMLPKEVARRPFGESQCAVAVYEFESTGTAAMLVAGSRIPVELQLRQNGVVAALSPGRQ